MAGKSTTARIGFRFLARIPSGMFSVSAVVMIAATRRSYALAGAVPAVGLAVTALVAPWTARLVDRYGQARVAVPAAALAAAGSLALLLCVRLGAPDWTLFAAYAATATTPNTGGMSRARRHHLLKGDPAALHTANSFEQAVDELCFWTWNGFLLPLVMPTPTTCGSNSAWASARPSTGSGNAWARWSRTARWWTCGMRNQAATQTLRPPPP